MTTPSTSDSQDHGSKVRPVAEPGGTRAAVKGQVSPRLPHEHDESSDSGTNQPTEVMDKAGADLEEGHTDKPRGPATQQNYSELTAEAGADGRANKQAQNKQAQTKAQNKQAPTKRNSR